MNRIFALACLLLLFVVALPLCAQPEVAPPSPPKPAPPPATPRKLVVKRLNLNNISTAECLKLLQTPKAEGGMKESVPEGIVDIVGLVGLNGLLVRAKDEAAIDGMQALVAKIDAQRANAVVTVKLAVVELFQDDADALLAKRQPEKPEEAKVVQVPSGDPWLDEKTFMQEVNRLLEAKMATLDDVALILLSGMSAMVDLRSKTSPFNALGLSEVQTDGESLSLMVQKLSAHQRPLAGPVAYLSNRQSARHTLQFGHVILLTDEIIVREQLYRRLTFLVLPDPGPALIGEMAPLPSLF